MSTSSSHQDEKDTAPPVVESSSSSSHSNDSTFLSSSESTLDITQYECKLQQSENPDNSSEQSGEIKLQFTKTPKSQSQESESVGDEKDDLAMETIENVANSEPIDQASQVRPYKRFRTISPGSLCRSLSMSDSDLILSSTPLNIGSHAVYKSCLDCKTRTKIEPNVTVTCKFCSKPICEACSATPRQIMSALDPLYVQHYVYTCENCRDIIDKTKPLHAAGVFGAGEKVEVLTDAVDKLTVQMGSLAQFLGKVDSNFNSLLEAVSKKADKEDVVKLSEEVKVLKENNIGRDTLSAEVNKLKEDIVKDVVARYAPPGETLDEKIEKLRHDLEEEEQRRTNLMVFNIPESKAKDVKQRIQDDLDMLHEVLHDGVGIARPPRPRKAFRVGNSAPDKHRPLKVIFYSEADKNEVFYEFIEVKRKTPQALGEVGISLDRTKRQTELYKKLKREKAERIEQGETNIRVKGNKVVPPFRAGGPKEDHRN